MLTIPAIAAVVCMPTPALSVAVHPDRPPAGTLPWLSVRSGRIVDSLGRTVLLRGFNDDALLQTGSASLPPPLTAGDAALMEQEGFDLVRLPISWSLLEPSAGHFRSSYLAEIRATVALCARHHLYVILDMHTEDFGVSFGGNGAPSWLYVAGIPDLHIPGLAAAWQRHLSPAVNAALAYFWLQPNWQRLYWQAWTKVAAMFSGDSAVAGYDLYNEPHPFPVPPAIFETRVLWPFYARGIAALARVDPNHLFMVEGDLFGDLPTAIRPLRAPNLVYSTHLYSGSILPPNYEGDREPLAAEIRQGLQEARQLPAAYLAGELGIDHTRPDAVSWAEAELALANRYQTGWAWWQWDDPDHWGVRQKGSPPDQAWLRVLAQPFVRAAPGRVDGLSYSPNSRRLRVRLAQGRAGASLLVSWPSWLGPPRVDSRCVSADGYLPGQGLLRLRLRAPACSFSIQAA